MAYSSSVYQRAKQVLAQRRLAAEKELERRHSQVAEKCPELLTVESEMARQGANIVRAIGMGEDAQRYIEKLSQDNLLAQQKKRCILTGAGYPEDYLTAHYTCEKCHDTGTVGSFFCECYTKLIKELAFEELARVSPVKQSSFESFRLDYYPDTRLKDGNPREHMGRVLSFCRDYAEDFDDSSPSLLLQGQTGLGKTHLSLAIASAAVKKGYNVMYESTQNLMNKLERERFGRGASGSDTAVLAEECDLLILDDLGAEFCTQFTVATLYNIINTRMLKGMPIIISTNLTSKELEEKYSQRIASRIIGDFIPLYFFGKDIRQIKAGS